MKRKCRKSLSCRMRWKALPWTWSAKSRHEQVEAKLSRREREMLNEGEEIGSSKRESDSSGIRRNPRLCERRQDYGIRGRETEDLHTERGGRSAKALYAGKKTLSYWQLASVVVDEGDEACTTNLCQKCFSNHLQAKGEEPLTNEVEASCGKEGVWGKNVENDGKRTILAGCGNISPVKDRRQRSVDNWPTRKCRLEYKVSGSRNRQPENTWSK